MYSPPDSYKKQAVKQAAIYILMTLAVISIVSVLILITLGYRFDRFSGTIEQGGLVQLNSIPSGAVLTINSARLGATTSARTTLSPGQHSISMSRDGYATWQKTIDLRRGTVLWLNYARLIPDDLPVEDVIELPAVTSTLPSPNREKIALTTELDLSTITLVDVRPEAPLLETLRLPDSLYTAPQDESAKQSMHLSAWDGSSRYLLVEHRYDDTSEWLVVDTEDAANSRNITAILDIPITNVKFSSNNGRILYALMEGSVRKIDAQVATVSAPLVRGVADFSLFDRSTIFYTTVLDEQTGSRNVGYFTEGADEARVIRSIEDDGSAPLHVTVSKYYNETYVAIAHDSQVKLLGGSIPDSDSDSQLSLKEVATMTTPGPVDYLSTRTDGRFYVAQHGNGYSVYDLELQKPSTTNLRGDASQQSELRWIDGYSLWSGLDGTLRLYEFDGANQHDIMPIVPGQNPTLTANNRYLYAPTQNEDGVYHLSRVRLILP